MVTRGKELMVGSVIIAAVAAVVLGTLWLQGTNFGRPLVPVHALLTSVGQLQEGNTVTYRGVRIGRVDAISVEPSAAAVRVTMLLDAAVPLPEDASVVLGPESLFGDWQAEVVSKADYPDFPFHEPGSQPEGVPNTIGGYELPEITRLTASAEQISGNLADLTDRLELAFNQETAENLARAIGNIEDITQEVRTLVQEQGAAAASISSSVDSALSEIGVAAEVARRSFERVDAILANARTDSILDDLEVIAGNLRDLSDQLSDTTGGLGVTLARADSAFARIDRLSARIEAGEGSLGRLLSDSTFVFRAEEALLQMNLLFEDLRENPQRYVRLSIF